MVMVVWLNTTLAHLAITTAEGDAQASNLLSKAFAQAGDGLIELRKIEAAEEIAESLSKSKNVAYLPKDMNALLALPQTS